MMNPSDQLHRLVTSVVMSGFMSIALSGVFTFLEFGMGLAWLTAWGASILIAWPLAIGLDLVFGASVRALAGLISKTLNARRPATQS
ncbi:DUF2798 domain-containing protein [Roseibium sp.]|uniref:DUF2798 domain-containing protein n=1 Tax=Roseibium sp. TaxID=1936156 RepID=UPI003BB1A315